METGRFVPEDFLLASGKIRVRFPASGFRNDPAEHFLPLAQDQRFAPPQRRFDLA